jgi:serine protease AprX
VAVRRLAIVLALAGAIVPGPARATQPFIWDQDTNGIDDRIESVHLLGWAASFELGDTTLHQRIQVLRSGPELLFGVYVLWNHTPTAADVLSLTLLGMPVLARIESIPASRSLATFAQLSAAAALPGVQRVEAAPLLYLGTRDGSAAIGVRDASDRVFPTLANAVPGTQGHGVVVAFLDTGVNDAPVLTYPGHEALRGRCLGGALFVSPDSLLQTPRSGSVNPSDLGGPATHSHATHVAGIAVGAGSTGGYAAGVAPQARFVDVKVLDDLGSGVALPEALDWCIANRARDWGSPDPSERGIDVVNLSLSSPDESDGQDLASRLAARAVELGMIVVASMGNDGLAAHVPSPAAGDGVIAVGAWNVARSPQPDDDSWAAFNNMGPRAGDGDADATDELKPDLLAPGVDVLSANGDLTSDGTRWQRLSGTSMAAAFVSGVCALLRERAPSASPGEIAEWLRATARRPLPGAPPGVTGADPRWSSTRGCGLVDAYAAWLESGGAAVTQLRRLALTRDDTHVTATLWTGREVDVAHIVFERAADAGGAPGAFAAVDSLAAIGTASLAGPESVHEYVRTWTVPAAERNVRFWYRAACTQAGQRLVSPAVEFTSPGGPSLAMLEITLVHDALDSDIEASVRAGFATDGGPSFELPGTAGAVASDWLDGTSLTGCQSWTFQIPVPDGAASAFLPPGSGNPWTLRVADGGSPTRTGRVSDFRLVWHAPGGDQTTVGQPLPRQTVEGGTVEVSLPPATSGVPDAGATSAPRLLPNPGRSGRLVRLRFARGAGDEARVFDIGGREVARVALAATALGREADWLARDARGRALPAGIYLVRGRGERAVRLVLLGP